MFKRILLAVDGSAHSERATAVTLEMAETVPGATAAVAHILGPISPDGHFDALHYKDVLDQQQSAATALVDSIRSKFTAIGIEAEGYVIRSGAPAGAIVDKAKAWKADIIIMGSRGLSELKGILLGSTSHRVIQFSPCPVLVVK